MDAFRTPDDRFVALDWPYEPRYVTHPDGLRQHYVDERPPGELKGTFVLLHGEPTWAFLYRHWIDPLVERGYRVVAPDHFGFGRSDKPVDEEFYTIARHRQALAHLVEELDLGRIHLVVQDWGGPIGLCTALTDLGRYARLFILNTWLHTEDYPYSDGIRFWRQLATDPEQLGGDMPTGTLVEMSLRRPGADKEGARAGFDAPFTTFASKAGARRFPYCLPFAEPQLGDAEVQQAARLQLRTVTIPVHLAFGDADPIFTFEGAEQWAAELPGATLDRVSDAGHFVQWEAPGELVELMLRYAET